ncbi:enolase-phosphatase E1 [Thunnus thynnus]|uniref:enolase-phosphatase E1 n=1 Tax=Thunnus thynnus TaxID=8237 RepID=UPI003529C40A
MSLKNSDALAVERRMDLASLFCMIGRHGPAVALVVMVMVSVLAGFIIYRTVRGKRRKATAAADGADSKSPEAERDASVLQPGPEPGPEESHSSVESTDVSDVGSSDVLKQTDLNIRQRRAAAAAAAAAAEKKPPLCSLPKSDIQVPLNKHTTSDDTEDVAVMRDSHKVTETYAEEATESLQSDTYTVAEMEVEDAVDWQQHATDDRIKDEEEIHDIDSCMKKPEPINDESCQEEEEKVFKAEYQENEDVTTYKDVSDKKTRQEEENYQYASSGPVWSEQTLHTSENNDKLQDNKTTLETNTVESNLEEPVMHIDDVPVTCPCYDKDEEFEDQKHHLDSIDYSNNNLSTEEEKKNEVEEAEEESVDYQEQETTLPSSQQDQCDHVTDVVAPPIQDSECDDDGGLAEVIEEDIDEDHTNNLTAVEFDAHSLQLNVEELQTEQKEENGLTCNQEVGVLLAGTDQVKENILTSDDIAACDEEHDSSNAVLSPVLPCLSEPVKVDNLDEGLSSDTTDAKAQISSIADFPDLSSDCQQVQKEDKIVATLDEDTDSANVGPQMPLHKSKNQPESNESGTSTVLAEECNDHVYESHVSSCCKDQQSVQVIDNDAFDEADAAACPDTDTNVTASVTAKEIPCPHLTSISQDCQSDHMGINETFDAMGVNSATEAAACDNASIAAPEMSEEISHPDMPASSQDQQSDQTQNNNDFSEVTTGAAPVMTEDINPPMCHLHLPSFQQSVLRDTDISSPGVGEESGISSMTVSPDLQDAGNEFGMTVENMALPVMDCDPQSGEQTEAQNNVFTDDVAISVIKEDTAGMVFGPYPSHLSQQPQSEHTDRVNYGSIAANEDMFGQEIEDSYQRVMDQFVAQSAANVTSLTDDLKTQSDMKAVVEVVEVKEKKEAVSAEKKKATEAEKEKDEDYEKTEISIMEATMDNNEWITESNYQVLPWMNLSVPSLAQDPTKTDQLPTEEGQHSSSLTDATCIDTNTPPSTDVKQTSTLSLVDENTENSKKVVAVQPMPQHVNVLFRVHYLTQSPYQTVAITGNQEELGNWKAFIPLERAKDGHWATVVSLPAERHVEWKFVVVDKGEVCRWEECGNRLLDTGYGDDLLVHKWWGFL